MKVEKIPALDINCPELFKDPEFADWLNRGYGGNDRTKSPCIATWHRGGAPHEFSDVFTTYDHGDGSDSPSMTWGCRSGRGKSSRKPVRRRGSSTRSSD
jgi:hypothetical protein